MDGTTGAAPGAPCIGGSTRWFALLLVLPTVLLLPGQASAGRRSHQVVPSGKPVLTLTAQSPTVIRPGSSVHLTVNVEADLPASDLGLQLYVYQQVQAFTAFRPSGLPTAIIPSSGPIPVGSAITAPTNSLRSLSVNVEAPGQAPTKASGKLSVPLTCAPPRCDGVYPLRIELVDRSRNDAQLTGITTDLIYMASTASEPLHVGLVLPVGTTPALTDQHTAALSNQSLAGLGALIGALSSHPDAAISLDLYPQLLVALGAATNSRTAAARLRSLSRVVNQGEQNGDLELLPTPFTPVNPSQLANAGIGSDFARQLQRSRPTIGRDFPDSPTASDPAFVLQDPVTAAGLALVHRAGLHDLVLPAANAALSNPYFPTAPVSLFTSSRSNRAEAPLAFVSFSQLNEPLTDPAADPVLAANQVLAQLAVIYFQDPALSGPRGVVVDPTTLPASPSVLRPLLNTLLNGLSNNPILSTATLSQLFSEIPVGSNGPFWNENVTAFQPSGKASALPGNRISSAREDLVVYRSIAPMDKNTVVRMDDELLLAESSAISERARAAYLTAVEGLLPAVQAALSITTSTRITLTSRQAKIPVTIHSSWPAALKLRLRLSSAEGALSFPKMDHNSMWVRIVNPDNSQTIVVQTKTSGAFNMTLQLDSPLGNRHLLKPTNFTVTSTAISSAAIALSIAALVVLLAWWFRSILRSRQRARRNAVTEAPTPG